jgi:hypothetical protein
MNKSKKKAEYDDTLDLLCRIDKSYSKNIHAPPADLKRLDEIKVNVRKLTPVDGKVDPPIIITSRDGYTLTKESYESCLNYYETMSDSLTNGAINLDSLSRLDLWMISIISPVDFTDPYGWKRHEVNKYIQCHSNEAAPPYRQMISYKLKDKIPSSMISESSRITDIILRYYSLT